MVEKIKDYKDLKIWQLGREIVKDVYLVSKKFPKEELYGLTAQIRRSAVSIPSNIAEGFARNYNKEYKHFLYISLGSCAELETQLILTSDLGFPGKREVENLLGKIIYVAKMTTNLIKKISIN